MEQIISWFFLLLSDLAFVLCAWLIVRAVPENIEGCRWKRVLAWTGYGVLSVLIPSIWWNDVVTMVLLCVYYVLIGRLFYFHSKMGMVCQVMYSVIMFGTQYMAIFLARNCYITFQLEMWTFSVLGMIFKTFLLLIVTVIMREIIRRRFKDSPYVRVRGMVIVPIFSIGMLFLYTVSSEIFLIRYGDYWILIFCMLLIVVNLYCLYFWYDVEKNGELKHRLELMQQQKELTAQYYEEMESNYNKSRKLIHDIRNHLHAMEQKYQIERSGYMEDVHVMLNSLRMKFYTENRILNIVMNDKLRGIPEKQVDCNLNGVSLEFISDMDITTIFANLLENAVDAGRISDESQKVREDFWLKIRADEIQDFTVVKISNPLYLPYQNGKSSNPGHQGIGLQNVKATVKKYHGEMEIRTEQNIFSVTIVFGENESFQ